MNLHLARTSCFAALLFSSFASLALAAETTETTATPAPAAAEAPASGEKHLLRYKFAMGEVLRYDVKHSTKTRNNMEGVSEQVETASESVKSWKVMDVLPNGEMQFMHVVEWVKMSNQSPDLPANKFDFIRFNTLPLTPEVVSYACEDALWVLLLKDVVDKKAISERPLMRTLEHKIMKIVADLEDYGVTADFDGIKDAYKLSTNFHPNMERAVKVSLSELAGRDLDELNLNSAQQMKKLLYHDVGLSTTRQTAKPKADAEDWEKMSTDAKAMTERANNIVQAAADNAAAAVANLALSTGDFPSISPVAKAPLNASPAAVVSTAVTGKASTCSPIPSRVAR